MPYYPDITVIRGMARIVRDRRLPQNTIPQPTRINVGEQIEAMAVVLAGHVLGRYLILDVADAFKMKNREEAMDLITAQEGQRAQFGAELARKGHGRRAKVLSSPADGMILRVEAARITMRVNERAVEQQAKIPGEIERVESHLVRIVGNGALLQCAWGNGGFYFGHFKFLPAEGWVGLSTVDVTISDYRGRVLISREPLDQGALLVAQQQEANGVVAPSMSARLREFAMNLPFPVLLTEGFGQKRPSALIYNLLRDNMGRQAAFNAAVPERWSEERPEIMIPLPSGGLPPTPNLDAALTVGATVRLTRAPWQGMIGEVVELPDTPQIVANGLRVPSAKVRLPNERVGLVPLANLELLG